MKSIESSKSINTVLTVIISLFCLLMFVLIYIILKSPNISTAGKIVFSGFFALGVMTFVLGALQNMTNRTLYDEEKIIFYSHFKSYKFFYNEIELIEKRKSTPTSKLSQTIYWVIHCKDGKSVQVDIPSVRSDNSFNELVDLLKEKGVRIAL